ncbi:hypothetical protein NMY22_g10515 [Coprinellus aureogranulatus]|nr:hypothetical protein NMY22_g10515 [Coprinellus aureogranulatus]
MQAPVRELESCREIHATGSAVPSIDHLGLLDISREKVFNSHHPPPLSLSGSRSKASRYPSAEERSKSLTPTSAFEHLERGANICPFEDAYLHTVNVQYARVACVPDVDVICYSSIHKRRVQVIPKKFASTLIAKPCTPGSTSVKSWISPDTSVCEVCHAELSVDRDYSGRPQESEGMKPLPFDVTPLTAIPTLLKVQPITTVSEPNAPADTRITLSPSLNHTHRLAEFTSIISIQPFTTCKSNSHGPPSSAAQGHSTEPITNRYLELSTGYPKRNRITLDGFVVSRSARAFGNSLLKCARPSLRFSKWTSRPARKLTIEDASESASLEMRLLTSDRRTKAMSPNPHGLFVWTSDVQAHGEVLEHQLFTSVTTFKGSCSIPMVLPSLALGLGNYWCIINLVNPDPSQPSITGLKGGSLFSIDGGLLSKQMLKTPQGTDSEPRTATVQVSALQSPEPPLAVTVPSAGTTDNNTNNLQAGLFAPPTTLPRCKQESTWVAHFEARRQYHAAALLKEATSQKQARIKRKSGPPFCSSAVFEWRRSEGDPKFFERVPVRATLRGETSGEYSAEQKRYDPVFNEWDCCAHFGEPEGRTVDLGGIGWSLGRSYCVTVDDIQNWTPITIGNARDPRRGVGEDD